MPGSKIQDEGEVLRWFEEGRTYGWMVEKYREKYNLETSPSMWSNFRTRHGLDRRIARNDEVMPWPVKPEHRWRYPALMLRYEGRRREGFEVSEERLHDLEAWKANLDADDLVVHYDPDTEDGFFYVPRRDGIDKDLIRVPDPKTRRRRAAK